MDALYKRRKVLVPPFPGHASMSVARFVPWGIQPERGIAVLSVAHYLKLDPRMVRLAVRRLGLRVFYPPASHRNRKRDLRGKRAQVSEEDAARLLVHLVARRGERILRAYPASPAAARSSP